MVVASRRKVPLEIGERVDWKGLRCLVTGASSGFGAVLARRMARRGAVVLAVARREDALASLVEDLGGAPHSHHVCDVSDLSSVRELAAAVSAAHPHLDIVVNNAGVRSAGSFVDASSEDMERVVRTDLLGQIFCTKELLPLLLRAPRLRRTPALVNMASMAGRLPVPGSADYTAAKFGLVGFTESIWHDLAPLGVNVMMVNPGTAQTEGFPMERLKSSALTRGLVMDSERVASAVIRGIERGAFEVRLQWWYHLVYHAAVLGGPLRRLVTRRLGDVARSDF